MLAFLLISAAALVSAAGDPDAAKVKATADVARAIPGYLYCDPEKERKYRGVGHWEYKCNMECGNDDEYCWIKYNPVATLHEYKDGTFDTNQVDGRHYYNFSYGDLGKKAVWEIGSNCTTTSCAEVSGLFAMDQVVKKVAYPGDSGEELETQTPVSNIELLLISKLEATGEFADQSYVQRLETLGGGTPKPETKFPCGPNTNDTDVPFEADYVLSSCTERAPPKFYTRKEEVCTGQKRNQIGLEKSFKTTSGCAELCNNEPECKGFEFFDKYTANVDTAVEGERKGSGTCILRSRVPTKTEKCANFNFYEKGALCTAKSSSICSYQKTPDSPVQEGTCSSVKEGKCLYRDIFEDITEFENITTTYGETITSECPACQLCTADSSGCSYLGKAGKCSKNRFCMLPQDIHIICPACPKVVGTRSVEEEEEADTGTSSGSVGISSGLVVHVLVALVVLCIAR